jgi:copper chaperone CopZ
MKRGMRRRWRNAVVNRRNAPPSDGVTADTPLRLRLTLPIGGLERDSGGAQTVERALEGVPGVIRAYTSPDTEMAYVEYDPIRVGLRELKGAIESVGYRMTAVEGPR